MVQIALGIALLVCGGLAVRYTKGQTDTFGPPYFLGAFIVGCLVSIFSDCVDSCIVYVKSRSLTLYAAKYWFTGPRSAVGNVSGYRCVSDCRSRGREFDPGPVPYFR